VDAEWNARWTHSDAGAVAPMSRSEHRLGTMISWLGRRDTTLQLVPALPWDLPAVLGPCPVSVGRLEPAFRVGVPDVANIRNRRAPPENTKLTRLRGAFRAGRPLVSTKDLPSRRPGPLPG
jgi:hypothetical protein